MKTITLAKHLTLRQIRGRMRTSPSRQQFQRWQVLSLAGKRPPLRAEEISSIVGVARGTVYVWLHRYRVGGPEAMVLKGRGGRRR